MLYARPTPWLALAGAAGRVFGEPLRDQRAEHLDNRCPDKYAEPDDTSRFGDVRTQMPAWVAYNECLTWEKHRRYSDCPSPTEPKIGVSRTLL